MYNIMIFYLLIGFVWLAIWDLGIQKMPSNGTRLRYLLLWPVTLCAFIVGFIQSWINQMNQ